MPAFLDLFFHLDTTLGAIIADYGVWTHVFLFAIVFIETGVVVMPFLPGDSLLFAAGTFAGMGSLSLAVTMLVLFSAAVLGDTVNYWIGRRLGQYVLAEGKLFGIRVKTSYLEEGQRFFARYGGKAVIAGRFFPIVRTFVPFVAGVARMHYSTFVLYNVVGALVWVGVFVGAGYFFGTIPVVRENFELVALGIVGISLLPTAIELLRWRRR
jgi:membrane-associated protein